jgi:hypothetical protein
MPSYYFHIRDKGELVLDPDGLELPDIASARDACRKIVRAVLDEQKWQDEVETDRQFEIVDELGRTVLVVPFREIETSTQLVRRRAARHR